MANAKDINPKTAQRRILLVGGGGAGKSTQFRTLGGKIFNYVFDPNAAVNYAGLDIEYEKFLPDLLNMDVISLTKDPKKVNRSSMNIPDAEPTAFRGWLDDFYDRAEAGFFSEIDVLGFDSFTTWADSIMDTVLWTNKRPGKFPEQDDWAAQMTAIQNCWRTLTSLPVPLIVCTAHEEPFKDEKSGRVRYHPLMTGKLRTRLPILFTDIFYCVNEGKKWYFQTVNDNLRQYVRTSIQGLDEDVDVTIPEADWNSAQNKHGLGRLLASL